MFEYVPQEPNSEYARHDLGGPPMPYTHDEMTKPAPDGFAMLNELGEVEASVFDIDLKKWIDGIYLIDPDTYRAVKKDGRKIIQVDFDDKNGVWFQVA